MLVVITGSIPRLLRGVWESGDVTEILLLELEYFELILLEKIATFWIKVIRCLKRAFSLRCWCHRNWKYSSKFSIVVQTVQGFLTPVSPSFAVTTLNVFKRWHDWRFWLTSLPAESIPSFSTTIELHFELKNSLLGWTEELHTVRGRGLRISLSHMNWNPDVYGLPAVVAYVARLVIPHSQWLDWYRTDLLLSACHCTLFLRLRSFCIFDTFDNHVSYVDSSL
jgi:hypothetical protein